MIMGPLLLIQQTDQYISMVHFFCFNLVLGVNYQEYSMERYTDFQKSVGDQHRVGLQWFWKNCGSEDASSVYGRNSKVTNK